MAEEKYWASIDGERVEISKEEYEASLGDVIPFLPSTVTVLYPVDLWSRLNDEEAEQVSAAMASQSVRIRNIFRTANSFRSDHELWPLLQTMATQLFGEARAAEILAPSE